MRESIRERSNMNTNEANGIKLVDGLMPRLIAIDHGWSSIKTPNFIFENGIKELKTMPATKENVLEYRGKIYVVGQGRMGKQETKTENDNYYLLTLVAIAREIKRVGYSTVQKVDLAVGVPLTLYGKEKKAFKNYL